MYVPILVLAMGSLVVLTALTCLLIVVFGLRQELRQAKQDNQGLVNLCNELAKGSSGYDPFAGEHPETKT